ncbi:MAG: ribosome small subunit-dependent GTPase A [Oligoflexales bacterium]|nr:ribosome small subunit-dependent GTPase A [Oligoflexales bacterium]
MSKWKYKKGMEDDDLPTYQKMRKTKKSKSGTDPLEPFEKPLEKWKEEKQKGSFTARVVEVHKKYSFVCREDDIGHIDMHDVWLATIARKFLTQSRVERNLVTVGDVVICQPAKDTEDLDSEESDLPRCVIENMIPRKSRIARKDPMTPGREHVIASNIDQLLIVASYFNPKIRWGLIDRFLVLAEENEIPVILVFTKKDLLPEIKNERFLTEIQEQEQLYRSLGYKVISLSTLKGQDNGKEISELESILNNKISIVGGHSGVGKSSLVNIFNPEIEQEVEENPNIFYKGRHTTTYASFLSLGTGGYVIDTPGVRSFLLLEEHDAINLSHYFIEFKEHRAKCKFRECKHVDEPGCAVIEAVNNGSINRRRYRSYLSLLSGESSREGRAAIKEPELVGNEEADWGEYID